MSAFHHYGFASAASFSRGLSLDPWLMTLPRPMHPDLFHNCITAADIQGPPQAQVQHSGLHHTDQGRYHTRLAVDPSLGLPGIMRTDSSSIKYAAVLLSSTPHRSTSNFCWSKVILTASLLAPPARPLPKALQLAVYWWEVLLGHPGSRLPSPTSTPAFANLAWPVAATPSPS